MSGGLRYYGSNMERILVNIRHEDGCWVWTGTKDRKGYGHIKVASTRVPRAAHRLSYEVFIGPIPTGMQVCHHCDNPPCCNPSHLFVGTSGDNHRDAMEKGRLPRGESHYSSIISEDDVREIRRLWLIEDWTPLAIAHHLGIKRRNVYHILSGETWKHVQ